jgi:hypothetical protein
MSASQLLKAWQLTRAKCRQAEQAISNYREICLILFMTKTQQIVSKALTPQSQLSIVQVIASGRGADCHWLPVQNSASCFAFKRAGTPTDRSAAV